MVKTALAIGAVSSALATTYSAYEQQQSAKKGRKMQEGAQQQAMAQAQGQQRASEEQMRRANRKVPDVAALLADAQQMRQPSTMLSGLPTSNLLGQ